MLLNSYNKSICNVRRITEVSDLAIVFSRAQSGIDAPLVRVEVHLSSGLPGLSIVGLPETAVKESKDRVRAAILNSHLSFPKQRITINLSPADLPKEGGRFDLLRQEIYNCFETMVKPMLILAIRKWKEFSIYLKKICSY
ncbi:MAG: hypothetical protein JKY19_03105 [Alcanivoracaceae bacterium]|nr:hypothetical protein [Alcanivoracaceae bacterium]